MQTVPATMHKAINDENIDDIRIAISNHPEELNVHTFMSGQTWLGYAAQIGKFLSVKALVDLGANINIGDQTYGAKPLCSACLNGNHSIAEFLIDHGSDIDVDTSARNPLFSGIVGRSPDCVRTVLSAGIDATVRYSSDTMSDMDAVAFALMRGERECAEIIASWNARGDEFAAAQSLAEADEIAERNAHA